VLVNNKPEKFDVEVIISGQEGMDQSVESLPRTRTSIGILPVLRRLCIKATHQVRKLEFKPVVGEFDSGRGYTLGIKPQVLKIDCSSALEVAFQTWSIEEHVSADNPLL